MKAPTWPATVTLQGEHVRLEALSADHTMQLSEATQDGRLWELWYTSVPAPEQMASEIKRRQDLRQAGSMLPFAVISLMAGPHHGKAVGMTTYMNIDAANRRLEIGSTWYQKAVQRTALNTDAKRLLLTHAFEELDCIAVEFRTHVLNHQSRRGIERLGAKLDGILRCHQLNKHLAALSSVRDTCVYSITAGEWPAVKAHLTHQLMKAR